jgi:hypothetical protein
MAHPGLEKMILFVPENSKHNHTGNDRDERGHRRDR